MTDVRDGHLSQVRQECLEFTVITRNATVPYTQSQVTNAAPGVSRSPSWKVGQSQTRESLAETHPDKAAEHQVEAKRARQNAAKERRHATGHDREA